MVAALRLNRLQRKVLLVVVAIVLVPMTVTGVVSASWVSGRFDASIERWIREAAEVDRDALANLHHNARLFADLLAEERRHPPAAAEAGRSPIPPRLRPLADHLGITLVQLYDPAGTLLYSSRAATLATSWEHGQDTAVVKVVQGEANLLAAVTIVRIPVDGEHHFRLVLGTLFDKALLTRLGRMTGLKTRLFYPRDGDFAKAFSEEERPLRLRLPPSAYQRLKNKEEYYGADAEEGRYWGLYTPLVDASGRVEAVLFNGLARAGASQLLSDRGLLTLAIVLFGTLLAAVTGLLLSRFVIRPVQALHDGVRRLAGQDFRATIPVTSDDELGELARAFNAMAAGLREARDRQRREFQRDKLAALGELSLAMAHEIRNPIGIIGTASRLLESAKEPAKRDELRRMIREESRRLDQLLKDFQQLARHRRPELLPLDPAEPLEKALQMLLAGRDEIAVERRFDHGVLRPPGDPELLRQAWLNLVRNALEAMGPGPGRLEVGSTVSEEEVTVYLQDSGPGIPPELLPHLFEPFHTTKEQGSGLGLTIANTLAEANGARLELLPSGHGARFALRLPITRAESP